MDGVGGRRRLTTKTSAEDQALDQIAKEAEARLWARRQARAEAREIRMRELERQQKEQEENADRQFDMLAEPLQAARSAVGRSSCNRYLSSRRSSEDSLEDGGSIRELKHELKELEEKFRKAMIANAQLDNDKTAQTYQLELLKDRLEELEEEHAQLKREHRDKCREHDQLKRLFVQLKDELSATRAELEERDRLIAEKGLVIVSDDTTTCEENGIPTTPRRALVTAENARLLETAGEGNLNERLARFAKEKSDLQDEISHLKLELEEERNRRRKSTMEDGNTTKTTTTTNGPSSVDSIWGDDSIDLAKETNRQLGDYRFRAQKAEQDVATLQAMVARLESQVIRYRTAAEVSEKAEEALKTEKRKLQREAREALSRAEELETENSHLQKRLDKMKNAKSTLFKELGQATNDS